MEVHAHSHTARKKWTHYLWEFLMLFLAVFCGFLSENQREHYVERKRERQYIRNLLQDIARDTTNYNSTVAVRLIREKQALQLVTMLYSPDRNKHLDDLYYFARQMSRLNTIFLPADATMNQLKNSGALRLIKKSDIADSIVSYNAAVEGYVEAQQGEINTRNLFRDAVGNIFDASVFMTMIDSNAYNPEQVIIHPAFVKPLITENKQSINHLCTIVHYIYSSSILNRAFSNEYKKQAVRLIELLKNEYHLK